MIINSFMMIHPCILLFSFEMVAGFVPQKHKRLMVHIRKMQERHKRKRKDKWEGRAKVCVCGGGWGHYRDYTTSITIL